MLCKPTISFLDVDYREMPASVHRDVDTNVHVSVVNNSEK